ncbi:MAG: rhomboid family intramembrane serine protease [Phycisphaerae bacterium]|nr:rhomboid family intramembrane serine protease [Phycisphaerae bacterium]
MLLPIRTSIVPGRTPYANYVLIGLNVVIFLLTYHPHYIRIGGTTQAEPLRFWAQQFMLHPANTYLWQFVSYAFLHGSWMHLIGNMYFLYLFGQNVNDRLGTISYVCLYLAGAIFAGIGHMMFSNLIPVLGASGAVAAITGAYLVLFPRTLITVVYWFYIIGTTDLSALFFIAFKLIVYDNLVEPAFAPAAVAYTAHLAGYAFGMIVSLLLIAFGFIGRTQEDLWFMLRQWNRRRHFRDITADGYDPFRGQRVQKPVDARIRDSSAEPSPTTDAQTVLRSEILALIHSHNLPTAAQRYQELLAQNSAAILPRQAQLDVANQLMSAGQWQPSAQAYELYLTHYSGYEYAEQVHLMLGLLYGRYLQNPDRAKDFLRKAMETLSDPTQKELCKSELDRLGG